MHDDDYHDDDHGINCSTEYKDLKLIRVVLQKYFYPILPFIITRLCAKKTGFIFVLLLCIDSWAFI